MFSQTCEYALRAVIYIAQHGQSGPVLARDVAVQAGIPYKYLQKLLTDLVRAGVLESTRGVGGGFRLRGNAWALSLAEVLAPFENLAERMHCPLGNLNCGLVNPCPVHSRWADVVAAYRCFLESTRIKDFIGSGE